MKNFCKGSTAHKMLALVASGLLFVTSACERPNPEPVIGHSPVSTEVGPEGGRIYGVNRNVVLEIPAGALETTVRIRINEGGEDFDGDFVMKTIEIRPVSLAFRKGVGLRLRYNGQLANGEDPSRAESLVLYHFRSEADFDKRKPGDMIWTRRCYLNYSEQCIETTIYSGGVFAIGEESLGQKAPFAF